MSCHTTLSFNPSIGGGGVGGTPLHSLNRFNAAVMSAFMSPSIDGMLTPDISNSSARAGMEPPVMFIIFAISVSCSSISTKISGAIIASILANMNLC